jgi:hypothetical protein
MDKKECEVCGGRGHEKKAHDFKEAVATGEKYVENEHE